MEKVHETITRETITMKFEYKDSASGKFAIMKIDDAGSPTYAKHGSNSGWWERGAGAPDFNVILRTVMKEFLENDINEFENMRDHLSAEYREMADKLRNQEVSEFDF